MKYYEIVSGLIHGNYLHSTCSTSWETLLWSCRQTGHHVSPHVSCQFQQHQSWHGEAPKTLQLGKLFELSHLCTGLYFLAIKTRHQPPTNQPTNRMVVLGGFWTKSLMSNQHTPASKYGGHRVLVLVLPFSKKDRRGRFLDLRENLNSKALKLLWAFEPPKRL